MSARSNLLEYEIVVAGGGPAGSLCALLLARAGRRVFLAAPPRRHTADCPEMLDPAGIHLLGALGLGALLQISGGVPCRGIYSHWQSDQPDFVDLAATRLSPGMWIERTAFDLQFQALAAEAGATVRNAKVHATGIAGHQPSHSADNASARFLIDAGGRTSSCCAGNLARRHYVDRLVAIPLRSPSNANRRGNSNLHLAPSRLGWWYMATKPDGSDTVVFLTDRDLLPRSPTKLSSFIRNEFLGLDATSRTVADLSSDPTILFRDARSSCRRVLCSPGWVPIGDAFFALDPLSGTGISRGLRMAHAATRAVDHYLQHSDMATLIEFATTFANEFDMQIRLGQQVHRQAARRFPGSPFWLRRSVDSMVAYETKGKGEPQLSPSISTKSARTIRLTITEVESH